MGWQSEYICVAMKKKMHVSGTYISCLSLLLLELSTQKTVWSALMFCRFPQKMIDKGWILTSSLILQFLLGLIWAFCSDDFSITQWLAVLNSLLIESISLVVILGNI